MDPIVSSRRRFRDAALPANDDGYEAIFELARRSRVVLLGEASHGTHEFHRERARITQALIEDYGYDGVAVEADWPDAHRVNLYVRGVGADSDPESALASFECFPRWMWHNADVRDFVAWLRDHNDGRPEDGRVGFYGLDLYSLHRSIDAVVEYLDRVDPEAAARARERYTCFEPFGGDPQRYGAAAQYTQIETCELDVIAQLVELQRRAGELANRAGALERDAFFAEQNARLMLDAERYYRRMFRSGIKSWNLRDAHMAETLAALLQYLGPGSRLVVWAHNSHIGDAGHTEMGRHGEIDLGQLARDGLGDRATLVGFTTYDGTVTAASDWDGPADVKRVRPALPESWEAALHEVNEPAFVVPLGRESLGGRRLERAIGAIYRPDTELQSHYFEADLADQFDAVIHIDRTRAVEPLVPDRGWSATERDLPESHPSGV